MFARCSTTTDGSLRCSASHAVDTTGASNLAWAETAPGSPAAASNVRLAAMGRRRRGCSMISRNLSVGETVTDLPDRDEVLRIGGIVLELLAQLRHVRVHRAREHDRTMVPDFAQELYAGGDGALPLDERHHELVRLRRQADVLSASGDGARGRIDGDVAKRDHTNASVQLGYLGTRTVPAQQ